MSENMFTEITRAMRDHYNTQKHDARFTPWGIAYFWDPAASSFGQNGALLWDAIPRIFDDARARGRHIVKPESDIPRAQGVYAHYSLRCMVNRTLVSDTFMRYAGEEAREIADLLDDSRLLREALNGYVADREAKRVPLSTDLFEYLLHNVPGKDFKQTQNPAGIYRHLLERLVLRYDSQNILEKTLELGRNSHAGVLHSEAVDSRKIVIPQDLLDAYHAAVPAADNNIHFEADPGIVSLHTMLGKRRVKASGGTGALVDWSQFMEEHLRRKNLFVRLDPVRVVRSRLTNQYSSQYLAKAKAQGVDAALKEATSAAHTCTSPEEQKALYTTIELLQMMNIFADAESTINRTMRIVRKE